MAETNNSTPDSRGEGNATLCEPFASAWRKSEQARSDYLEAKVKLEAAQRSQAELINALPEPDRADMEKLQAIDDQLEVTALGDALFARLTLADQALDAMMRIEAPSVFAMSLKLQALAGCPWEYGQYIDRLAADASILSLQFAEIWLERWKAMGGSVCMDRDDPKKAWIGLICYSDSPVAVEDAKRAEAAGLTEGHSAEQKSWHRAFFDGRSRELYDVLDAVPGALAAVKAIVSENPARGLPDPVEAQEA